MRSFCRTFAAAVFAVLVLPMAVPNLPVAANDAIRDLSSARRMPETATRAMIDVSSASALALTVDNPDTVCRLNRGEVVVDLFEDEKIKFVVGKILIKQPPDVVWPILVNPFEFKGKLSPHMTGVDVLSDTPFSSVLRCTINVCFLFPNISYTVESKYDPLCSVEFHRIEGFLRDFRGCWLLRSCNNGTNTEVFYSMFVDPGMPVPRWLVREGVKSELPHMLKALRNRIDDVAAARAMPVLECLTAGGAQRNLAARK
jgi:hypothetical protein